MKFLTKNADFFLVFIISVFAYFIICGVSSIDINNHNIALRGFLDNKNNDFIGGFYDISVHYLGSVFYRLENFGLKIFSFHNVTYPYEASVLNTDSIPIFALIFKILNKMFGLSPFTQYFGIWTLLCFILQGIFSVLILRELKFDKLNIVIASIFLVLSPIMIVRIFEHSALAAHFLILASIYLYIKDLNLTKRFFSWFIVLLANVLIQPNFLPMCFAIYCADCAKRIFITHEIKLYKSILYSLILFFLLLSFINITGLFSFNNEPMRDYGVYSTNLNFLFNPVAANKISSIIPKLPVITSGQYEGFCYLGFGIIILLFLSIIETKNIKYDNFDIKKTWPIYIAILALLGFSLSNKIYFAHILIFSYNLPEPIFYLFNIFRTSGRMVWPIWYIVYFTIIYILFSSYKKKKFIAILCAALLFQIIDLYPLFKTKHEYITHHANKEYKTILTNSSWYNGKYAKYEGINLIQNLIHLQNFEACCFFSYFWFWIAENNKNVNFGYLSRIPKGVIEEMQSDLNKIKNDKIPNNKRLYVLLPSAYNDILKESKTNPKAQNMLKKLRFEGFGIYVLEP